MRPNEKKRYHRNIILPNFGEKGQEKLRRAKVLIIGIGGLGSPAALYLAANGVGTIGLVDNDSVDISNLQRQILHFSSDLKIKKVESAEQKLKNLNQNVTIKKYATTFDKKNASQIIEGYDFVLDCADNFESKLLINKTCIKSQIPFSHAGISEYKGQLITILPKKTACYKCAFPLDPPQNNNKAVLGVVPGVVGILQATEAIKYITNIGKLNTDKLLIYDSVSMDFRKVKVRKKETCAHCGTIKS
ncbi:ThiF family adenylyltransferase [bacterium]